MRALTRKEKKMATFGLIFIAGWSVYTFLLRPVHARLETLTRVIPEKQAELQELKQNARTVAELKSFSQAKALDTIVQPKTFSLIRYLSEMTDDQGLTAHLSEASQAFESHTQISVTVRLEQINVAQLITLTTAAKAATAGVTLESLTLQSVDDKFKAILLFSVFTEQ